MDWSPCLVGSLFISSTKKSLVSAKAHPSLTTISLLLPSYTMTPVPLQGHATWKIMCVKTVIWGWKIVKWRKDMTRWKIQALWLWLMHEIRNTGTLSSGWMRKTNQQKKVLFIKMHLSHATLITQHTSISLIQQTKIYARKSLYWNTLLIQNHGLTLNVSTIEHFLCGKKKKKTQQRGSRVVLQRVCVRVEQREVWNKVIFWGQLVAHNDGSCRGGT